MPALRWFDLFGRFPDSPLRAILILCENRDFYPHGPCELIERFSPFR
jgi:hypothetical protein